MQTMTLAEYLSRHPDYRGLNRRTGVPQVLRLEPGTGTVLDPVEITDAKVVFGKTPTGEGTYLVYAVWLQNGKAVRTEDVAVVQGAAEAVGRVWTCERHRPARMRPQVEDSSRPVGLS